MTILVTGATGTVGSYLVRELLATGHPVRALTRNAARANFPQVVEVVEGDLTRTETLEAAMQGIQGLHLINFGGDDFALLENGHEIITMAEQAGVKRITVLMGPERSTIEDAVEASSVSWTFLQPVEFMSGMLSWAYPIRDEGIIREPFADRKTAMIHEADIAAVAARALTEDAHAGKTYVLTGPEALTPRQALRIIGEAIGRNLQFVELTEDEARQNWQANGLSDELIEFMMWAYGNTPEIGYTVVPTIEEVTGKAARSFKQWVSEHVDVFRVLATH